MMIKPSDLPATETTRDALVRLDQEARRTLAALDAGQWMLAQNRLEDCLLATLQAMQAFGIEPASALNRALDRQRDNTPKAAAARMMKIYPDRAELLDDGVVCGTWPIGSAEEAAAFVQLGHELQCVVEHTDNKQLALFS